MCEWRGSGASVRCAMGRTHRLALPIAVVAAVGLAVGTWSRGGQRSALSESRLYWVGSNSGGAGYYADLVNNPGERPEEYLEKQRQIEAEAAEAEQGAAARSRRTSLQQVFHVPDLEQETDGLDLMQDFAPGAASMAVAEAPAPAAPPAKGDDDESVSCVGRTQSRTLHGWNFLRGNKQPACSSGSAPARRDWTTWLAHD